MIKKITLIILFCFIAVSCGKKGDPEYKDPKKTSGVQDIIVNKA